MRRLACVVCLLLATATTSCSGFMTPRSTTTGLLSRVMSSSTTNLAMGNEVVEGGEGLSRRQLGELAVAAVGLGVSFLGSREVEPTDYGLYGILPVGP